MACALCIVWRAMGHNKHVSECKRLCRKKTGCHVSTKTTCTASRRYGREFPGFISPHRRTKKSICGGAISLFTELVIGLLASPSYYHYCYFNDFYRVKLFRIPFYSYFCCSLFRIHHLHHSRCVCPVCSLFLCRFLFSLFGPAPLFVFGSHWNIIFRHQHSFGGMKWMRRHATVDIESTENYITTTETTLFS